MEILETVDFNDFVRFRANPCVISLVTPIF